MAILSRYTLETALRVDWENKVNRLKLLSASVLSLALLSMTGCLEEDDLENLPAPGPQQEQPAMPAEPEPELQPIPQPAEPAVEAPSAGYSGDAKSLRQNSGFHVVQVGIAPSRAHANKLVNKLSAEDIPAYVAEVENPADYQGTFYRIRVGYFATLSDAESYGKNVLEPLGYAFWVDNRSNDNVGNPGGETNYYEAQESSYESYESQPASSDWGTASQEEPAQDAGWGSAETQEEPAEPAPAQDAGWGSAEPEAAPAEPAAAEPVAAEPVQDEGWGSAEPVPTEPEPTLDVAPTQTEVIPENAPETVEDEGWGEPAPPAPATEEPAPATDGTSDGWGAPAAPTEETDGGWGAPAAPEDGAADGGWSDGGDEWN